MPNWCSNSLVVYGDKESLNNFNNGLVSIDGYPSILLSYFPRPEFRDTNNHETKYDNQTYNLENFGAIDWYDWSVDNWGTKWGDCNTLLILSNDKCLEYSFDTAWSPPIEGIQHISSKFPTLTFMLFYSEQGMGFMGHFIVSNGVVMMQESGPYIHTAKDSDYLMDIVEYQIEENLREAESND